MKTRSLLAVSSAALVAVVFFIVTLTRPTEHTPPKVVAGKDMFSFVHSLAGTQPPDVTLADDGMLIADVRLRHMFDYYLSTGADVPLEAIRAKIEAELDRTLKPAAAKEAKRLLASYLDFKAALIEMEKNPQRSEPGLSPIRARLMAIQQIRARFFTPKEIEGMFGFDDANDMDSVARLEINQDKSLTLEQKKAKLAALDAAMPQALREAREAPMKVAKMEETAEKMRANGATDDDVYRMRAKVFSPEAATRLAELDQRILNWKQRIATYQAQRNMLLGNTSLSDTDRQTAIQQLRDGLFSNDEQKRLAAYE
ncbi:MAG: lipase secretion chaperone [Burkholderiales bacterium]